MVGLMESYNTCLSVMIFLPLIKSHKVKFYCQPMWSCLLLYHCCVKSNIELWQLQSSGRSRDGKKEGWEIVSDCKVNTGWFSGVVTVNLFIHKVVSPPHLDNTVNSNQDSVMSNYRPSAPNGVGCSSAMTKWHMESRDLFTTFPLMQGFHTWAPERCADRAQPGTGPYRVTTCPTTGDKLHTKALNLCLCLWPSTALHR